MKIDGLLPIQDRTEISARKKQQKELRLLGSMKHKDGMTLFSVNAKTNEVKPAEFEVQEYLKWEDALKLCNGGSVRRKVQVEKDCVYVEALNAENAMKHYRKGEYTRL